MAEADRGEAGAGQGGGGGGSQRQGQDTGGGSTIAAEHSGWARFLAEVVTIAAEDYEVRIRNVGIYVYIIPGKKSATNDAKTTNK